MATDETSTFLGFDAAPRGIAGAPERDPICGMELSRGDAVGRRDHQGRVYLFCSEACQRQFDTIMGLRTAMGTSSHEASREARSVSPDEIAVRVAGVAKTYRSYGLWPLVRRTEVLTDASLEVARGEIAAIVGGNGSGKSTLMNIIVGAVDRDAGEVEVRGQLGHCPQHPVLYDKLTVNETFELFGVAYSMEPGAVAERQRQLVDALDFGRYKDSRVDQLSGGTRQKLNLAVALLHDPAVLLLDEPYSGFDYETYLRFWDISETLAQRGRAILVVSHFVQQRERFTRVFRVRDGRCERER